LGTQDGTYDGLFYDSNKVFLVDFFLNFTLKRFVKYNPQAKSEPHNFDHGGRTPPSWPHFFTTTWCHLTKMHDHATNNLVSRRSHFSTPPASIAVRGGYQLPYDILQNKISTLQSTWKQTMLAAVASSSARLRRDAKGV
jgi:hypothetical protein